MDQEHARPPHGYRRHDSGCEALGIPLRSLERELRRNDSVGSAPLLLEAVREAIAEVTALAGPWGPAAAQEALEFAIRGRITPRPDRDLDPSRVPALDADRGHAWLRAWGARPRTK